MKYENVYSFTLVNNVAHERKSNDRSLYYVGNYVSNGMAEGR